MKALQIGFALVVGVVYIFLSMANPGLKWPLRLGALVLISLFFILTNVLRGRPALESNNPLEPDEIPSLNLTERALQGPSANERDQTDKPAV